MAVSKQQVLDAINNMSVMEVVDLIGDMEQEDNASSSPANDATFLEQDDSSSSDNPKKSSFYKDGEDGKDGKDNTP